MLRKNVFLLLFLILLLSSVPIFAQTPAGTVIENQAQVTYEDTNGNQKDLVQSNIVTVTVTQVAGVELTPLDASKNTPSDSTIYYGLTVTNTGNGDDSYDLDPTGLPADWTTTLFIDENNDGLLDPGDTVVTNTGTLAQDESLDLIAQVTVPADATDGTTENLSLTVNSDYDNTVTTTANYKINVTEGVINLDKSFSPADPLPGEVVNYTITMTNSGAGSAQNLALVDQLPEGVTYVSGSMQLIFPDNSTINLTDLSDEDQGEYDNTVSPPEINLNISTVNSGEQYQLTFDVILDSDLSSDTKISNIVTLNYENENGDPQPEETSDPSVIDVGQYADIEMNVENSSFDVTPGDDLVVPIEITNTGNGPDTYDGSYSSNYLDWNFYCDNDGDGLLDTNIDTLCVDSDGDGQPDTGEVQPGETVQILAVTNIPENSNDLSEDSLTFTATSSQDSNISEDGIIKTTVHSPSISVEKSVSPSGENPPGTELTYTVIVTNNGSGLAKNVKIYDKIPTDTTYVNSSVEIDGVSQSDNVVKSGNEIIISIEQLGSNGGNVKVTFKVTID